MLQSIGFRQMTTNVPTPTKPTLTKHPFWAHLFAPVDIASLVFLRIAFGAIMLWEVWRYNSRGWIRRYYITPDFHFTYYGFDWIDPLPDNGMYLLFAALGALAFCIMLGILYRFSTILFFVGFTYVFLLDQARYLNHFYLVSLISFLIIFVPAHRAFSIDALFYPKIRSNTAPRWALWLMRFQLAIPYIYGGIAKLNGDWLRGEPMRGWLADRTDFPLIGELFTEEWMVYLFSYSGLLLDLLVVPLLLWRRTRIFAFAVSIMFHLVNARLFQIGIFPWFMLAATLIFFPPDLPRRVLFWRRDEREHPKPIGSHPLQPAQWTVIVMLGLYGIIQILFPFRHLLYPGNVSWTEEGHRFAWHMKLRDKDHKAIEFFVTDPVSQKTWELDPDDYLTFHQRNKMADYPDMVLQFCHYLATKLREQGYEQIEVRAAILTSLNGRDPQFLINPTIDLASQPRNLMPAKWIMPLVKPLVLRGGNPSLVAEVVRLPVPQKRQALSCHNLLCLIDLMNLRILQHGTFFELI
jgi:vitamin K-dependent gamma-carboxylase